MTDLVRDVVWFEAPDGGEVKVTFPGYAPKEVESMKQKMIAGGYSVTSHTKEVVKEKKWELPSWVVPSLFAFVLGMYVYAGWLRFL